jgi:hypothetical protein
VVAYDAVWPEKYTAEVERLRDALCGLAAEIQHTGSTAVRGSLVLQRHVSIGADEYAFGGSCRYSGEDTKHGRRVG